MCADEKMSIDERRKYLRTMQKRYGKASRQMKKKLLDEIEAVTEMHRKSLMRLMRGELECKSRHRQQGRTYGPEMAHVVGVIAESLDYICAERLKPNLVWMAHHLAEHGELAILEVLLKS